MFAFFMRKILAILTIITFLSCSTHSEEKLDNAYEDAGIKKDSSVIQQDATVPSKRQEGCGMYSGDFYPTALDSGVYFQGPAPFCSPEKYIEKGRPAP